MQKEVEQFLQKYGVITSQDYHKSELNRVGTCYHLKPCGIYLARNLFQTATVREHLLLEVLHAAPGIDDALLSEILPINVSLQVLKIRLKAMAEKSSRQYIRGLAFDSFREENIKGDLEMLPSDVKDALAPEVEQFNKDSKELNSLISKRGETTELIKLHNKLDAFNSRVMLMRLYH